MPTVPGELAGAVRRGKAEGRLGPEHRLDVARARLLAEMLVDEGTPRSAIAALDRRLDVILSRLGFVADATGPTELDEWLAGLADETAAATVLDELDEEEDPDESAGASPPKPIGPSEGPGRRRSPGELSGSISSRGRGSCSTAGSNGPGLGGGGARSWSRSPGRTERAPYSEL